MFLRHVFIVLSLMLLVGCQSEDVGESSAGKPQSAVTMHHLKRDKIVDGGQDSGAFSVTVFPAPLTSADQATAVLRNCQEESRVEWQVAGEVLSGEKTKFLDNKYFRRGDSVRVVAYCGSEMRENTTIVQNSPPVVTSVKFQSLELISGQDLTVVPVAEDLDGDSVSFNYEWTVDGLLLSDLNEATLPGSLLKKGTQVALVVTPYDDYSDGISFKGLSFYIPNTAPVINSQPPPLLSSQYVYNVVATDPDNDELKYRLDQGPSGMKINEKTGVLTWSIDQSTPVGTYDIEIIVEDSDGSQARQFYTLSLSEPELTQ